MAIPRLMAWPLIISLRPLKSTSYLTDHFVTGDHIEKTIMFCDALVLSRPSSSFLALWVHPGEINRLFRLDFIMCENLSRISTHFETCSLMCSCWFISFSNCDGCFPRDRITRLQCRDIVFVVGPRLFESAIHFFWTGLLSLGFLLPCLFVDGYRSPYVDFISSLYLPAIDN